MKIFPDLAPQWEHDVLNCNECRWDPVKSKTDHCFRYQVLEMAGKAARRRLTTLYIAYWVTLIFSWIVEWATK